MRQKRATRVAIQSRLAALTARERQVFDLVVAGKMNKQIAAQLGAAEKTVKVHRGRVMFKMRVRSVAELVTLATQAREASRPPYRTNVHYSLAASPSPTGGAWRIAVHLSPSSTTKNRCAGP